MNSKFFKWTFWSGVSLLTISSTSSLGLMMINSKHEISNLTPPPTSQTLTPKQQKQISEIKDSTNDLNFRYDSETNGYAVSGFKSPEQIPSNYTLIIPKTYNGDHGEHPVTKVDENAFGADLASVNTPKPGSEKIVRVDFGNVEIVGSRAFLCQNLESVTFNETLKLLDDGSFAVCPKLKSFTIPRNKDPSVKQTIKQIFLTNVSGFDVHRNIPSKVIILCDNNVRFDDYFFMFAFSILENSPTKVYTLNSNFLARVAYEILEKNDIDIFKRIFEISQQYSPLLGTIGENDEFLMSITASDHGSLILVGLNTSAKNKTDLTIPAAIQKIDEYSFTDRSDDLKYITFSKQEKIRDLSEIGENAFLSVPDKTKYRVHVDDSSATVATALKNNPLVGLSKMLSYKEDGDLILQGTFGGETQTEWGGLTKDAKTKNEILVSKQVTKFDDGALDGHSADLKSIRFEKGINPADSDPNVFSELSPNVNFYAGDNVFAENLHSKFNIEPDRIYYPTDTTNFTVYQNIPNTHLELTGLTEDGKKSTTLTIPNSVSKIAKTAFTERSTDLNTIIFEDDSKINHIDDDAFKNIPNQTLFYTKSKEFADKLNQKFQITKERVYYLSETTNFTTYQNLSNDHLEVTGLTQDGQNSKVLTIPDDVVKIRKNSFVEHLNNLERITFQSDNIGFDPNALDGLNNQTVYFVDTKNPTCSVITNLKQQIGVNDTKIYLQSENKQDISVRSRLDHQDKVLVGLSENGLAKNQLTIPNDINWIDSEAFKRTTHPISTIIFSKNSKLTRLDHKTFANENLRHCQYIVDINDLALARLLNQNGINNDSIILNGSQYAISVSGILTEIKSPQTSTNLIIPKTINGIDVNGIGSNAFKNYSDIKQIEFSSGINLNERKIDTNAFSGFSSSKTILYTYNDLGAPALNSVSQLTVGVANEDFFSEHLEQNKLVGLTLNGRKQTKLKIPSNIVELGSYTFLGCSESLNQINIDSQGINLGNDVFSLIPSKILENIQFYVVSQSVKDALLAKHIKAKNIHFSASSEAKAIYKAIPYKTIGIIVGSICVAILLLGLGIGLPMRKQHKISMLQAKLNGSRIDKLSAANAMAFRKVVDATGSISQQVNKLTGKMNLLDVTPDKGTKTPQTLTSKLATQSIKPTTSSNQKTNLTETISSKPVFCPTKPISPNFSTKWFTTKNVIPPKSPINPTTLKNPGTHNLPTTSINKSPIKPTSLVRPSNWKAKIKNNH